MLEDGRWRIRKVAVFCFAGEGMARSEVQRDADRLG